MGRNEDTFGAKVNTAAIYKQDASLQDCKHSNIVG
jgi:hypothetical protein